MGYLIGTLKVLVENSLDYWYDTRESLETVTPETDMAQSSREDTMSLCWSDSRVTLLLPHKQYLAEHKHQRAHKPDNSQV